MYGKGHSVDSIDMESAVRNQPNIYKRHRRWDVSKIKAVHWTRYLLQYTAIEIFFNNSVAPIFLNFGSPRDAKHVGTLVVSLRNESLYPKGSYRDKNGIISFVDRRTAVEMAETVRESWKRRELSNFEYLMLLNTLAGRSYNDLTQYPVFPWVLADYSSEKLDFNKSSTFRDLSKPVGALDSKRFEVFEDRYRNFCDPDIPSFYYGSHYSSMGIVLFYLLRLEPFTALHRNLQGGKFDHADRLFQSIEGTFRNCLTNTSDVKELIPEFFYMPEFLANSNSYHFGVKQDGKPLSDVALPPWAKGSPEEFIQRNREALESEYVSSNLHHWIDLVFGYKQRGKPAVEAANVFYYLTYEGAVDLESMDDALQKSAIEDQIANFGQTPIQLFRKKHPRRGPPIPIAHPLYFAPSSITLSSTIPNTINPPSPVLFVGLLDSNIVVVNQGLTLSIKLWLTTQLQSGGNFTFSGSQEPFFGIGADVLPPRKVGAPLADNIEFGRQCLATMQTPNDNYLILCGNWENSFQVISLADGKMVQSIRQHKDLVSCVAVTSDGSTIATGSFDTTVMVWKAYRGRSTDKRSRNLQSELLRKDRVIIESPFHILCGHDDIVTCLFISLELDIVISGSKDGTCVFHTLREGRYVRSIRHPSGCSISKLVVSKHGRLVVYADDDLSLHMYSINGKHVASSESNGRLNCIELSRCGDFLVCAGDHGQIVVRSMHSLDVVKRYEGVGRIITSLTVTPEECFLVGTKDGSILLYCIENPQLRKGSLPRNSKSKSSAAG
ncbi:BEACH domain-containing protein B [Iris pallida]|uniref:BEACH domain-containing protein B n=1 Tax=Iris pallida TaxID=29817 RepID=A0AAX6EMX6_IRIPA|nr:BEACH domain-containing protein B [Iris pallida]